MLIKCFSSLTLLIVLEEAILTHSQYLCCQNYHLKHKKIILDFSPPSLSLIFRTKLMLLHSKSLHWSSLCSHTSSLMASHPWILDTLPFTPQCKYDEPAWRGFKETNNEIWEYLYGFHIYQIEKILGYTSLNTMQEWRHGCNLHMQKLIILPNDTFQQSHTKITAALWCSSAFV